MSVFSKVLRAGEGKKVRALRDIVPDINAMEPEYEALSDEALAHKTVEFREQIARATSGAEDEGQAMADAMNDLLIPAFAVVREGAKRVIGQRHFDVQLMGGAALHFGWIAEMKTGEGSTASPSGACTSSPSTTTWPPSTPSGWVASTSSSASPWAWSAPTCGTPT
jgi:preprotein translocase subunit SecA